MSDPTLAPNNEDISVNAQIIEETFKGFGITTRVEEVNKLKTADEFCIRITQGTSIDEIMAHQSDLALALASPTGKVEIVAPIPGTSFIGITVPRGKRRWPGKLATPADDHVAKEILPTGILSSVKIVVLSFLMWLVTQLIKLINFIKK